MILAQATTPDASAAADQRDRMRAGFVSLVAGAAILGAKFLAWHLTGSTAVLSDALESIVNVVAAVFLLGSLRFAGTPADRNHPYGHGKIEYFSAVFEGGLVTFAGVSILVSAVVAVGAARMPGALDLGLAITGGAALANAVLGLWLVRQGRRSRSLALVADGKHVLADVWTSAGVVGGLALVSLTRLWWIDPLVAALVGLWLLREGFGLVRQAAGGLLDEEDRDTLEKLLATMEAERPRGLIRVHHLRALRAGARTHVDAHLVMPEFWTIERSHAISDALEQRIDRALHGTVDVVFHADPCRREYCARCDVSDCAVRVEDFVHRPPIGLEEAVSPDPPKPSSRRP